MSSNTNTKPRAQRIDSQDEATSGPPVKTDRHSVQEPTQPGTQRDPGPRADTYMPRLKTTRNRLLTITQRFASFRTRMPMWSLAVLALLFVGPVAAFEPVFGGGVGAIAAGAGVACGLAIAFASTKWRWDAITTALAVLATYFLLGSAAALRSEALFGVLPTGKTLQVMVLGSFRAWKDLLTLTAPVSAYSGPALVPWMCGLLFASAAGLITARAGRALLGSVPVIVMGAIALFFGLSGQPLPVWSILIWWGVLAAWWAVAAQYQRITLGQDVLVGRSGTRGTENTLGRSSRSTVYVGTRVVGALLMLAISVGIALPAASFLGRSSTRVVGRDLVEPPLDIQAYPSPMASFRHYTTDLKDETLITVSDLPEGQRVRIAAMDVYDGTTFGMSDTRGDGHSGYIPVETTIPGRAAGDGRLDGDVAGVAVASGIGHAEGCAVVDVHRGDAHALALGQVGDGDERLVLQVRRVVAERGHGRGVGLNVQGRLDQVAADDARARATQEGGGGQGDAHGDREHEESADDARAHVDGGAGAAPECVLGAARPGTAHEHVLTQRDALILGGHGPPGSQNAPPDQDRPHGQRLAGQAKEQGDRAHHDDRNGAQEGATGAGRDQSGRRREQQAAHPRHEGRARVCGHGRGQRQQVLPRAEGAQDHDLEGLAGGQNAKEGFGAQGGGAAQQEVCGQDGQGRRDRVPAPLGRRESDREAARDASAGGDSAHSPAEDGLKGGDRSDEEEREDRQRPHRHARAEGREALRDRQQAVARRLEPGHVRVSSRPGVPLRARLRGLLHRVAVSLDGRAGGGLVLRVDALSAGLGVRIAAHARPPATIMRGRSSRVAQSRRTPRPRSRRARTLSAPIRMMDTGTSMGAKRARWAASASLVCGPTISVRAETPGR